VFSIAPPPSPATSHCPGDYPKVIHMVIRSLNNFSLLQDIEEQGAEDNATLLTTTNLSDDD